jgi:hypothetical protein
MEKILLFLLAFIILYMLIIISSYDDDRKKVNFKGEFQQIGDDSDVYIFKKGLLVKK